MSKIKFFLYKLYIATQPESEGVNVVDPNLDRSDISPVMGDFDGDSFCDLGIHNLETGKWEIAVSDKGEFKSTSEWLDDFGASKDFRAIGGDFNGDGRTDIGVYNNKEGELNVALSSGLDFSDEGTWLTVSFASHLWSAFTGNFNGDKYTDFALYNQDTGEIKAALGTGIGFSSFTTWHSNFGEDYIAYSGDFNGDSLSDVCLFKEDTGEFKVAFSNSGAFVDDSVWITDFSTEQNPIFGDFNCDGLTDIGYWDKGSQWYYAVSTASS